MARPLSITLEIEANELRRRIALGDTAPVDTRKALQQLGVLCVFMPMQETFSGMCLKHKEKKIHACKFKSRTWSSTFYYCT